MGGRPDPQEPRLRPAVALRPLARAALGAALVCAAGTGSARPAAATGMARPAAATGMARPAEAQAADQAAVDAQAARVKALTGQRHRPAYGEALIALAALKRRAGDTRGALAAAREAAAAFDAQVELHKALADTLPAYDEARAERRAALTLGLRRDDAFQLVAELAEATRDEALAIRHYVLLVQSQADQPRGREAYAALRRLGWAASPAPGNPTPLPSPLPRP